MMNYMKSVLRRSLSLFLVVVLGITMLNITTFATAADTNTKEAGTDAATPKITEQSTLNERLDALDAEIHTALRQRKQQISTGKYYVTMDEFTKSYIPYISAMHPIYTYIVKGYSLAANRDDILTSISIAYKEDETKLQEMNKAASEIISVIDSSPRELADYEKAFIVYNWLAGSCQYYPGYKPGDNIDTISDEYFTAYNALVNKTAVCTGFASGYAYIMDELLDIPCERISYPAGEHVWDMVQIDGSWYHVDPTWGSYNGDGDVIADYFMLTDTELAKRDTRNHCSITTLDKSYRIKSADGPSFSGKDPMWSQLDSFNFEEHDVHDIAFYDGYYYYSYVTFLCRTDSLLNFSERRQIVGMPDSSSNGPNGIYDVVMPRSMGICVYNDCIYYHGLQRIYRLNPAELSEEEKELVPGKSIDVGKDITLDVIKDKTHEAYDTLDLDGTLSKRASTTFIDNFRVKDNHITFIVQKNKPTPARTIDCDFEYLSQDISSFNDDSRYFSVSKDLAVGTELTASATVQRAVTPEPYETATPYYRWYRDGLQICKNTTGKYTPTLDDIGKMLRVEVTYDNFSGKLSKDIGMLPKMVPTLPGTAPETVTGEKGSKLADIEPPSGYIWKEPDTVLTELGEHSYPASYSPNSAQYEYIDASLKVHTTECNHIWDEGWVTKKATCTQEGERTYTCSKCNDTKVEAIEAIGHRWNNGTITTKATCTHVGTKTYTCNICRATKTEEVPKTTTHSYKTGKITKAPTDTAKGTYLWTCSECSSQKTVSLLRAKTGNFDSGMTSVQLHSSSSATSNNTIGSLKKNVAITIFEENSNPEWTKICYKDGVAFIKTKYVIITTKPSEATESDKTTEASTAPKTGSSVTVKNVTYKVTTTSTVEFTKAGSQSKTVTIPASIKVNGKSLKVTSIAAKAMKNNKKVTKVVIGSNVTKIGANAFNGCSKLKTITIKSSKLKTVGKNAIKNIYPKAKISCPKAKKSAYKKLFKPSTGYKKTMKVK